MNEITGDKLRGHLETMVLSVLERGEAHGLEIIRRLDEMGCGLLHLKEGSLYPAMYRLEARGKVAAVLESPSHGRRGARRRIYRLTRWSRLRELLERLRLEPGESLRHFFLKHATATFLLFGFALLTMLPVMWMQGRMAHFEIMVPIVLTVAAVAGLFNFAFVVLIDRLGRAMYGQAAGRGRRKAVLYGFLSLMFFPAFTVLIYSALLLAPAGTVLFVLIARRAAEENRQEEEWANLSIDESP